MRFKCRVGFHNWGRWWTDPVAVDEKAVNTQHRECHGCGKKQIRRVYIGV